MSDKKTIYITRPALPPLEEFNEYLKKIWDSRILTNNGPFHRELERKLADFLGVEFISLFANGTLALITALQALRVSGEVITTPFSFVATTHALWWNKIQPVFVDIEPQHFNLDPEKVEAAISPQTTAILPVHVYGNPCQNEQLQRIADTHGLKLIYDAAHAFGVTCKGSSVMNWGTMSVLSFHATKVYNTMEGGAIVCHEEKTKKRIDTLKNFGFTGETTVIEAGINAKMNELQAAIGLLQLKYVETYIAKRQEITQVYRSKLKNIPGLRFLEDSDDVRHNYAYFPILIDEKSYGRNRNEVYELLKKHGFYCRRYFYPLISEFPIYRGFLSSKKENLPIAHDISAKILCLPIYPELQIDIQNDIMEILINT